MNTANLSLSNGLSVIDDKIRHILYERQQRLILICCIGVLLVSALMLVYVIYKIRRNGRGGYLNDDDDDILHINNAGDKVPFSVIKVNNNLPNGTIPRYFVYKKELLTEPINQRKCGSCYIISVCNMLSDRISIASGGRIRVLLSYQYLLCTDSGNTGAACDGGGPEDVLEYISKHGAILEEHMPYQQDDIKKDLNTTACVIRGRDGLLPQNKVFVDPKSIRFLCNRFDRIGSNTHLENVRRMKREILENGCIVGTVYVHDDLYDYKPGTVYKKGSYSKFLYGHSVEIVGFCDPFSGDTHTVSGDNTYGHDFANEPYWIVKNSWGLNFGLRGYMFIRMYKNEVEIESRASAALPKLSDDLLASLIQKHHTPLSGAQPFDIIY